MEEIGLAIDTLDGTKAPGLDGYMGIFYKTYKELLIPQLIEMYAEALDTGILPPTFWEAVVILLLKPGKDPLLCGSYRPLSLLNYENKILAKVLSTRLSLLLDQIISPEQSGFVPQRSTSLNLRTVFATLHRVDPTVPAVITLLDAEKAFDSLEWPFLQALLKQRGFPNQFTALVSLLYTQPTARLRLNGTLSSSFPIMRGTRQGSPLSPLLFILAMDPLVRRLRADHLHRGIRFKTGPLLVSLYADDILFVSNPEENLSPIMREIVGFGGVSGLHINWMKSKLFPLTDATKQVQSEFPMAWRGDTVRYLGVVIHRDKEQILQLNYGPAIAKLTTQIERWIRLPLSIAGRIAIIKMVILPRFLYLFTNIPIPLTNAFFSTMRGLLTRLIWAGRRPRVNWQTLVLPYERGGYAVPHFHLYYLVAQCHYAHHWYHPDKRLPYAIPESDLVTPQPLRTILPLGIPLDTTDVLTVSTACWAWRRLARMLGAQHIYSPAIPLIANPWVPITTEVLVQRSLKACALLTFGDAFPAGHVFSRTEDSRFTAATYIDHFVLARLQGALRARIATYPLAPEDFPPLTLIIGAADGGRLVSRLYHACLQILPARDTKLRQRWETDLGRPLTDEMWTRCCDQTRRVSFNHRHKLLHFKFLRRCYVTPVALARYDASRSPNCPKCQAPDADFVHMAWNCPLIAYYWTEVFTKLTTMTQVASDPDPLLALLGYVHDIPKPMRRYTAIALLLAKREVAIAWGSRHPPKINTWLRSLAHCDMTSELFASLQPITSRPRDIWQPLRDYMATLSTPSSTQ